MRKRYSFPFGIMSVKGAYIGTFPDIPEVVIVENNESQILSVAVECFCTVLCDYYIHQYRDIPTPTRPSWCHWRITPPLLIAAKLALYQAMLEAGMTRVALGKELGENERAVRRLLDFDHQSHIGGVEAALAVLGKRLEVEMVKSKDWF